MSDQPKNLEVIEQGATHGMNITFLNRAETDGGTPTNPDGFTPNVTVPGTVVTAQVRIYNTLTDTYSAPPGAYNAPTLAAIAYDGDTGKFVSDLTALSNTRLSSALVNERWAIQWTTTINGVTFTVSEFFTIVATGSATFGDTPYCTPEDVALLRGEPPFDDFGNERGRPTRDQVLDLIQQAMDDIDGDLKRSFRSTLVVDEVHSLRNAPGERGFVAVNLGKYPIRDLDPGIHKIEVFNGSEYENWLLTRTQGVNGHFYINQTEGILYLRMWPLYLLRERVRVTYSYGETDVPGWVKRVCTRMVAIDLETTTDRPGTDMGDRQSADSRIQVWERQINNAMNRHVAWSGIV